MPKKPTNENQDIKEIKELLKQIISLLELLKKETKLDSDKLP